MALTNPKVKSMFGIFFEDIPFETDIISFSLESQALPPERVTFSKYTSGAAVEWKLKIRAAFDGGSGDSLHAYLWSHSGLTAPFILRPFQEIDPLTKRFYQGNIRMPYRPDIKVSAGKDATYDYEFKVLGQPSRGDAPNGFMTAGYYDEY